VSTGLRPLFTAAGTTAGNGSRRRVVAAIVAAVLIVHAWLLAGLPLGATTLGRRSEPAPLRQVVMVPPPARAAATTPVAELAGPVVAEGAESSPVAPSPAGTHPAGEPVPPPAPAGAAPRVEPAAAEPAAEPATLAAAPSAAEPDTETDAAGPGAPPTLALAEAGTAEVPTYATRLPPPATLRYELKRGLLSGRGLLHWLPGPDGYQLTIEGHAFGMPILAWWSRGGTDAAGLAPMRFVDRRRARALRAANFQRDRGRITYSGTEIEQPLLPGAQDRLSWLVQLAGIVEADPRRFGPGAQVLMQVTGARGDAEVWTFSVLAREQVELSGGGTVEALMIRRSPRRDFDTLAEVWLDPARHHLPVRLRLTAPRDADALEFLLRTRPADGPGG